jgi:hypothetical protein
MLLASYLQMDWFAFSKHQIFALNFLNIYIYGVQNLPLLVHLNVQSPCKWVNASYGGSLLWRNNVFSLGTLYSNAYGD